MSDRPLRIAFGNICTNQWIAGCHYLRNLSIALKASADRPEVILYGSSADNSKDLLAGYVDEWLVSPIHRFRPINLAFRLERRLGLPLGVGGYEANYLRQRQIDAVFIQLDQGQGFNLPLIAWLADFQHLHLPEMFSPKDVQLRNRAYRRTARRANRVVLSSHNALRDFQQFAPESAQKGRVVHFVAQVPESVYASDPAWICGHYQIPQRFVYVPNQFWKHKNHQLVVEAVARLRRQGNEVAVVCSGNTRDDRNPDYYRELQTHIERLGVQDRLFILGMIPHDHIFQLIRQSLAVLQPSQFEGWSTAVEETKSIGKRILLSDIEVHREQKPPAALYFDPHDPQALADGLATTFEAAAPGPDLALELQARKQLPRRTQEFGETFMQLVHEIVTR
jgi:glycosyltransferase involved in cell wall biosynthesis